MARKSDLSIHFAVKACVTRCRLSDFPLTTLAEFSNEIRCAGWDTESVATIEREVLRELAKRDALGRQTIVVPAGWRIPVAKPAK